ncbi:MAG: hypothetical protein RLY92_189 [Chloroflexota bacterium]
MDLELRGKVALVTAASKGLGRASAMALAAEGAHVAISARSALVEAAATEIGAATGAQVLAIRGDVSVAADVVRMVAATIERFGQIDILVINAGGPPPGSFLSLSIEQWEQALQLTLLSAVRLCHAVVPHMRQRASGSIVAIQSASVKQPVDNLILSNSIRLAVIGLLKSLAFELGPHGIRVNSLNPSSTQTERIDQLLAERAAANHSTPAAEAAKVVAGIPLGRMGTPEEFGRTLAWLASPAASYVHGQAVMFDGGAVRVPL